MSCTLIRQYAPAVCCVCGAVILGVSGSVSHRWAEGIGCVRHVECEYRHQPDTPGHSGTPNAPWQAGGTETATTSTLSGSTSMLLPGIGGRRQ